MKITIALSILITLFSANSFANEPTKFDILQIDNKSCSLVQSGTDNKDVIKKGESQFGMCFVNMPVSEFNKKYSYCALSGVLASKGKVQCQFGFYDREKTEISFTSGAEQTCQFSCLKN